MNKIIIFLNSLALSILFYGQTSYADSEPPPEVSKSTTKILEVVNSGNWTQFGSIRGIIVSENGSFQRQDDDGVVSPAKTSGHLQSKAKAPESSYISRGFVQIADDKWAARYFLKSQIKTNNDTYPKYLIWTKSGDYWVLEALGVGDGLLGKYKNPNFKK